MNYGWPQIWVILGHGDMGTKPSTKDYLQKRIFLWEGRKRVQRDSVGIGGRGTLGDSVR